MYKYINTIHMHRENCESQTPDTTNKKSISVKTSYELIEQKTGLKQYANEWIKRPRTWFWWMLQDLSQLIRLENMATVEKWKIEQQMILDKRHGLTPFVPIEKNPAKISQYSEPVLSKKC